MTLINQALLLAIVCAFLLPTQCKKHSKYNQPISRPSNFQPRTSQPESAPPVDSKYQYLFINKTSIFNLTDRNFNNITLYGRGSRKWFIMFYASWCVYSRELMPIWRDLSKNYTGKVNFGMVDCDIHKHLKDRFLVRRYPTLILLSNGTFTEFKGVQDMQTLSHFIEEGFEVHPFEDIPMDVSWIREIRKSWGKLTVLALVSMILLVGLCCICECFDKKDGEESENEESDDETKTKKE